MRSRQGLKTCKGGLVVEQRLLIVMLKGEDIEQRGQHRREGLLAGLIGRLFGPKCGPRLRQKTVLLLRCQLGRIRHGDILLLDLSELLLHLRVEFLLGPLQRLSGFRHTCFDPLAPRKPHADGQHVVVAVATARLLKHIVNVEVRLAFALRRLQLGTLLVDTRRVNRDSRVMSKNEVLQIPRRSVAAESVKAVLE